MPKRSSENLPLRHRTAKLLALLQLPRLTIRYSKISHLVICLSVTFWIKMPYKSLTNSLKLTTRMNLLVVFISQLEKWLLLLRTKPQRSLLSKRVSVLRRCLKSQSLPVSIKLLFTSRIKRLQRPPRQEAHVLHLTSRKLIYSSPEWSQRSPATDKHLTWSAVQMSPWSTPRPWRPDSWTETGKHSTTTTETSWTHPTTRGNIRVSRSTPTTRALLTITGQLWLEIPSLIQLLSERQVYDSRASRRTTLTWQPDKVLAPPNLAAREAQWEKHLLSTKKSDSAAKKTTELTLVRSCRNGSSVLQATSSNEEPTLRPERRRRYKLWMTTKTENKV